MASFFSFEMVHAGCLVFDLMHCKAIGTASTRATCYYLDTAKRALSIACVTPSHLQAAATCVLQQAPQVNNQFVVHTSGQCNAVSLLVVIIGKGAGDS
jgi:hypothetical protein